MATGIRETSKQERGTTALAALILLLTAVIGLVWSHARMMWQDEFLSFYTDSVATAHGVVDVQLHYPISLDPPAYHLLSHTAMDLFGRNAMALRLPALLGFLLMELALFALVRKLAGGRAGVLAMSLPLLTASFRYAVEGRPYGLLLGLYASAFFCWYTAAARRDRDVSASRIGLLAGMALSIALAITSHYFGILILVPLACGELARIVERKRIDWPVTVAMALGFMAVGLILPFQKALKPYRQHYYISGVSIHAVSQGYRELFVAYTHWPMVLQRITAMLLLVGVLALAFTGRHRFRSRPAGEPASLWIGLVSFAALPLFSFLFGKFVTHTMEVRYVIATLIPFAVVLALVLAPRLERSATTFAALLSFVLVVGVLISVVQIHAASTQTQATLASMATPSAVVANPSAPLYTQSLAHFFLISYYAPDAAVRARTTLVYGHLFELAWTQHDTNAITAEYMQHFTPLHVAGFCDFIAQPHPLLVTYDGDSWIWINKQLDAMGLPLAALGPAYDGRLMQLEQSRHCYTRNEARMTPFKK